MQLELEKYQLEQKLQSSRYSEIYEENERL